MTTVRRILLRVAFPAALFSTAPLAFSGNAEIAEALLRDRAATVVVVRAVMKISGNIGEQTIDMEQKIEEGGVVVDPSGLVLVGTQEHVIRAALRHVPGATIRITPTDIRIVFGDDLGKEHEAVMVVRDDSLGLAYVQVTDLGEKKVAAVEFPKAVDPAVGSTLYGISRMGRGFDHAPEVFRTSVCERIEQPRAMWGVRGGLLSPGVPLYDASATPVGLVSIQFASEEDLLKEGPNSSEVRLFLLPLGVVKASISQASKRVPAALLEAKAAKETKEAPPPAAPEAPATPEKPK